LIIVSDARQKNARQKNEEWPWSSSFFCLAFFCLVSLRRRLLAQPQVYPDAARRERETRIEAPYIGAEDVAVRLDV
jgi:hypothetical protein